MYNPLEHAEVTHLVCVVRRQGVFGIVQTTVDKSSSELVVLSGCGCGSRDEEGVVEHGGQGGVCG